MFTFLLLIFQISVKLKISKPTIIGWIHTVNILKRLRIKQLNNINLTKFSFSGGELMDDLNDIPKLLKIYRDASNLTDKDLGRIIGIPENAVAIIMRKSNAEKWTRAIDKYFGTNFTSGARYASCEKFIIPEWLNNLTKQLPKTVKLCIEQEYFINKNKAVAMAAKCRTYEDIKNFRMNIWKKEHIYQESTILTPTGVVE